MNKVYIYKILKKIMSVGLVVSALIPNKTNAQGIIEIEPLFEYPIAPEEMVLLSDKSNYLVDIFWDKLDFNNKEAVNQIALNDAFHVYLTPLRWADEKHATQSLDRLINRISGNPTLLVQFAKAAEENLYGPRAEFTSDEIYLRFLDAAVKNKKLSKSRKEKFSSRSQLIRNTSEGAPAPSFKFINVEGKEETYFPMSTPTIIIFGDPEDTDWRFLRLKLDSDLQLSSMLDKGKLNIIYIAINKDENWKNAVSNYSRKWKVGESDQIKDIYDIRTVPSVYLIGQDGKILMKNVPIQTAIAKGIEIVN